MESFKALLKENFDKLLWFWLVIIFVGITLFVVTKAKVDQSVIVALLGWVAAGLTALGVLTNTNKPPGPPAPPVK